MRGLKGTNGKRNQIFERRDVSVARKAWVPVHEWSVVLSLRLDLGAQRRRYIDYGRIIPGNPPPMRIIIFLNLPIFFIACCVWLNLFNSVFNSATLTPLPLAMR